MITERKILDIAIWTAVGSFILAFIPELEFFLFVYTFLSLGLWAYFIWIVVHGKFKYIHTKKKKYAVYQGVIPFLAVVFSIFGVVIFYFMKYRNSLKP